MNKTISVCLVVKNEEKYLKRCLTSIKNVADEIIVVDTGSDDRTVEVAREFTDRIFEVRWRDDFSKARNFALNKATGDWVLMLDGDEELDPGCITLLREKVDSNDSEGYLIKVVNYYDSGNGVETAPDVVFRLFRNNRSYRYTGAIHEQICENIIEVNPKAKISIAEDICIIHYGYLAEEISAKNKAERNTRLLEKAVQKNPHNLLDRFHLGVEYFRSRSISKALGEFLFVLDKVNIEAVYAPKLMRYVAECQYLLRNLEECMRFIDDVWSKKFPDQGDLYFLKGLVCKDLGCHAEAYTALKHCLNIPAQPAHYANLYSQQKHKIFHLLGEIAEFFADQELALENYISALRENPRSVNSLGRIVSILNPRDYPEYTMKALNSVFDLTDSSIQLDLGHICFKEGAYSLALNFFDSAISQKPIPIDAQLAKGLCLMRLKQYHQANVELRLIPPDNEFYTTAQGNLFLCNWLDGHVRKAVECLKNIKTAAKKPALAEVLDILRKKRNITPDELKSSETEIYSQVNEIFERLIELGEFDRFQEAWNCFEGLFTSRPAKQLGDIYFKYRLYDKAEAEYRIVLEQSAADAEIFYRLGKACWALNDLSKAEKYICTAVVKGLNYPRVNRELARLYQDLAVQSLEQGLAAYPENKELSDLLEKIKENLIDA